MSGSSFITINPGTMAGDASLCHAFKASTVNGGATILAASFVTGLAGTLDICLVNFGTAGTVTAGTIAGMSGGTTTVWVADVPQSLTLTAANVFVDAGEWVVIKKLEASADDDLTADASICIEYVDGIVTQG